ncbi:MAG: hypothetical protein ACK5TQ_06030 [Acetobacteraceae bacterium]
MRYDKHRLLSILVPTDTAKAPSMVALEQFAGCSFKCSFGSVGNPRFHAFIKPNIFRERRTRLTRQDIGGGIENRPMVEKCDQGEVLRIKRDLMTIGVQWRDDLNVSGRSTLLQQVHPVFRTEFRDMVKVGDKPAGHALFGAFEKYLEALAYLSILAFEDGKFNPSRFGGLTRKQLLEQSKMYCFQELRIDELLQVLCHRGDSV